MARRRVTDLGAQASMTRPFQREALLKTMAGLLDSRSADLTRRPAEQGGQIIY